MSLEVIKGIGDHLEPKLKQQLSPKLRLIRSEDQASTLLTALDSDTKSDDFTDKQWAGLQAAYLAYLEAVTGSTELPDLNAVVSTGWKGDLTPIQTALTQDDGPFQPHGTRFWSALSTHEDPHCQVDSLARGQAVCPTIMRALPRGAPRNQILNLLRGVVEGSSVAEAK